MLQKDWGNGKEARKVEDFTFKANVFHRVGPSKQASSLEARACHPELDKCGVLKSR